MQVSVESLDKAVKRLTVIVPIQRVDKAFDKQLVVFAKKVDIKGFRPGKASPDFVKQRFGEEVRQEATNAVIQETLNEALSQEKLTPISAPRIDIKVAASDAVLEYTATFDVLPEIGEINFKTDTLQKLTAVITDKDIEQTLGRVQEQHLKWNKAERPAKDGDRISATIQMTVEGKGPLTPEPMPLEFILKNEPSVFGWNLIEKLQGMSAGEKTTFTHTLPEEAFLQTMAGQTLEFTIEVKEVFEPELPEMNEALVKKLGVLSGKVEDLRAEIRKQLELNLKRTVKNKVRETVFEKLIEQNAFEIPASLIQREAQHLHDENCSHDQAQHKHSKEDEAYFAEVAKKRIQLGLLVGEYATKNKISPSSERVDEYISELATVYADSEEYVRRLKADKNRIREIEGQILEDQVVEKLLENVSIVEKEVSYEELIAQGEDVSVTQEGA